MEIVIIGAGPAGYEAAIYAAKRGAAVTLVEKNRVGGTCLNVGCIPTKALLASSEAAQAVRKAGDFGLLAAEPQISYPSVAARKDKVVAALTAGVEQLLAKNGVRLVQGVAQLAGGGQVEVALAQGGSQTLNADAILLATGSVVSSLPFAPLDGHTVLSSDEVLALSEPPASLIVVGGGVIGCEMGQFMARMGTQVTIVEALPHLLAQEDEDTSKALERQFRRDKIKVICNSGIVSVRLGADGVEASLADGKLLSAQKMLVAVGRRPATAGLGLKAAGVQTDARGFVVVDEHLQAAEGVYAAGDILPTPQLAHLATREAIAAIDAMLGEAPDVPYHAVPRCVYTQPEVACVGKTERELQAAAIPYSVGRFDNIALGKAKASGTTDGFAKILVDDSDVIVGAALIGAHATEMVSLLTLAITKGITAQELGDIIFPHPSMSEAVMEALHDVHGMSIHKL